MSDDNNEPKTYTDREILLEFFPATDEHLLPASGAYRLEHGDGHILLRDEKRDRAAVLIPISQAGNASTQICCDLCTRSAPRHFLQMFRAELPGSKGRRYRYVSLCKDVEGCNVRRMGDASFEALLERVLGR